MADQVVDLEEAVGSYLNCLSTSCAAGSKLYTSVGKLVDDKFQELFPGQEPKLFFQALQTQNAFEGYQKALLECKDKLLEILIDNHTKRQPPKEKSRQSKKSSAEEQYAGVALRVAKELYCYHQTVAEVLKPLHFSDCQEDLENSMLTNIDGKTDVVAAWMAVVEGNKLLRNGYGLTNCEVAQILCWQHGEDLAESTRKKLNLQVNTLLQKYVDRMFNYAVCEQDIPIAFSSHPEDIQKVLQACCNPAESMAASSHCFLTQKEEITTMLHRELPRVFLTLNGKKFDKAHPGKAYENATLKMKSVRESISNAIDAKKIDNSKEQVDLFCLRILAIASMSAASAACRTAVVMAFGKVNLVQVQPIVENDKHVILDVHKETIDVYIHSKWAIVEDSTLFKSLCRNNSNQIATIHVTYHAEINIEQFFVKRLNPVPVVHITQCILQQAPTNQGRKEPGRERSKSIKIKLTKATNKLFQRKSVMKSEVESSSSDIYTNEFAHGSMSDDLDMSSKTASENGYNTSSDSQDESQPVPPPRTKRKAKKTKKSRSASDAAANGDNNVANSGSAGKEKKLSEAKKDDLAWYSSSNRFGIPLVPTFSGTKDQSPSVASFEELQGVIDFLSGSSTSSLALNEKGEKLRQNLKTHKRNNSTTSLPQADSKNKTNSEGKIKLCHKKSASFSGKTTDLIADKPPEIEEKAATILSQEDLKKPAEESKDMKKSNSSGSDTAKSPTELVVASVERTPGDGMDNKINKDLYQSTANIDANANGASSKTLVVSTVPVTEEPGDITSLEKAEVQEVSKLAMVQTPLISDSETKDLAKSSDLSTEYNHVTLNKQFEDNDIAKSLPSNLHTASVNNQTQPVQKSSTLAKLESYENVSDQEGMWIKPAEAQPPPHLMGVPPPRNQPLDLANMDASAFELEQGGQGSDMPGSTLYEPFNSRTTWSLGLGAGGSGGSQANVGGSRFRSLWSDGSMENEKTLPLEDRSHFPPSSVSSSSRSSENEFTLDKQQDFHKLLEGSKFFAGYRQQQHQDSWKDRHYQHGYGGQGRDVPPLPNFAHNNNSFDIPSDPWPVQSQSNFGSRDFSSSPSYTTALHKAQNSRSNIESLQLPQNPVGPYMRQNREQLLAKQQILEQYARQQKQIQLQQQQQQHQSVTFPPSLSKGGGASMMPSRLGLGDRPTSSAAPPGLNTSKFDDRLYYQRSMNQQSRSPRPMSTQNFPMGMGGMGGMHHQQTRSVNDVRMENSAGFQPLDQLMSDRMPPYRDHLRHLQQDVFSTRY